MTDPRSAAGHVRVETTVDDRAAAERLARAVVEARLVACAQVGGPITSFYRWEGEVQADQEWTVVMKTTAARLDELTARLLDLHPYDEPEVVAVPVTGGSAGYLAWVSAETGPKT
ncbi:divalent-cation tolerance protein CutA [Marinactinospora thermotolerans]|uniref:Divalent cation tolerance protein n=1 Tax=Marinactinospora thermotolerans DSM 45154 TaxID=1122192 RepID=A0A1T4R4A0_9ACTN|nr:divalent-cation tolerance protein CutA [Marinactinospora thermotolerans]SKA10706.1 divalent cation tolerance protein [Marinactinospora thermotolerans DSM 45154]